MTKMLFCLVWGTGWRIFVSLGTYCIICFPKRSSISFTLNLWIKHYSCFAIINECCWNHNFVLLFVCNTYLLNVYQCIQSSWNFGSIWRDFGRGSSSRKWTVWAWGNAFIQGFPLAVCLLLLLFLMHDAYSDIWCFM